MEILGVHLLIIPELIKVILGEKQFLKSLVGRYQMSTTRKFIQGVQSTSFKVTVLMASNRDAATVLGDSAALNDRFVIIPIKPRIGNLNFKVLEKLARNECGFINWALDMDSNDLNNVVRAAQLNIEEAFENNDLALFVHHKLIFEPNSEILQSKLFDLYKKYMAKTPGKPKPIRQELFGAEFSAVLNTIFEKLISRKRVVNNDGRKVYAYLGLRLRNKGEAKVKPTKSSFQFTTDPWIEYDLPDNIKNIRYLISTVIK